MVFIQFQLRILAILLNFRKNQLRGKMLLANQMYSFNCFTSHNFHLESLLSKGLLEIHYPEKNYISIKLNNKTIFPIPVFREILINGTYYGTIKDIIEAIKTCY